MCWSLTYPEIYEVGASNLGHIILYSIINSKDGQLCDREYLPAPDLSVKLHETNAGLFALQWSLSDRNISQSLTKSAIAFLQITEYGDRKSNYC